MKLGLKGLNAVVTGASAGIGLACARALAREGVHMTLVARSTEQLAKANEIICAESGSRSRVLAVDIGAAGAAREVAKAAGDVDILVNNAGAIPFGSLDKVNEASWRESWDLKVFGYVNMTREMLKRMQPRGSGVILNVIGIAGAAPTAEYICGSSGNAALIAFTNAMGAATAQHGVRVLGVNPGLTSTERIEKIEMKKDARRARDASLPFGRMMTPDEVANFVTFCVSPLCSYLSGTTIDLDGGRRYTRAI